MKLFSLKGAVVFMGVFMGVFMRLMNLVSYIFVHQDARYAQNHELRIEVNVLIIRATSCTLRGVNNPPIC